MTNVRPIIRPTHKLAKYWACLLALQMNPVWQTREGQPFWNLCTGAHSNHATPLISNQFTDPGNALGRGICVFKQ